MSLLVKTFVINEVRSVGVDEGIKSQPIPPATREILHVHPFVAGKRGMRVFLSEYKGGWS